MFVWVEGYIINMNAIEYVGKVYGERTHEKFTIYLNSGRDITIYQQQLNGSPKIEDIRKLFLQKLGQSD